MKIKKREARAVWFKYTAPNGDEVEVKLRPYPFSMTRSRLSIAEDSPNHVELRAEDLFKEWNYCLEDWKGLKWENGKTVKFDEENKKLVFDLEDDFRNFISSKMREVNGIVQEEIKN